MPDWRGYVRDELEKALERHTAAPAEAAARRVEGRAAGGTAASVSAGLLEETVEEIAQHLDDRHRELVAGGLEEAEAARRVRREWSDWSGVARALADRPGCAPGRGHGDAAVGSAGRVRNATARRRRVGRSAAFDALGRDLRHALRVLRKSPAFTAAAVLTLGLAIGANTAILSVVDAVLLEPLPYAEPERLAWLVTGFRAEGVESEYVAQDGHTWQVIDEHLGDFDRAVYSDWTAGVNLVAGGEPVHVQQQRVGAGYFGVLGVAPSLGREFTRDEDRFGGPAVAILSHGLWQRLFAGDPSVVGSSMLLRGEPYTVVGVMPRGFRNNVQPDVWTPVRPSTSGEGSARNYRILVRLPPDMPWAEAEARVDRLAGETVPERRRAGAAVSLSLLPLQEGLTAGVRRPLMILWGAVAMVLLIACVNLAGLLIARVGRRSREMATRMALGGGRGVVFRQLLIESLVLGAAGGLAGVVVGALGLEGLELLGRESLDIWQPLALDARVLAATAALSLVAAAAFGVAPAFHVSRMEIQAALTAAGGRGVAGGVSSWPRRLLVVGEVALGVVLLIGAGLLLRTLLHLRSLDPGFDPTGVLSATASLQDARYTEPETVGRLFDESLARIREIPGVESAGVGLGLPYERLLNMSFRRVGGPSEDSRMTNLVYVTPGYFEALRMPLRSGRGLDARDRSGSTPVIVVNAAFVRTYFADEEPLGHFLQVAGQERRIVGVVAEVQQRPGWGDHGPLAAMPVAYVPVSQTDGPFLTTIHQWFMPTWVVRSATPVEGLVPAIRGAVRSVDPLLPLAEARDMSAVRATSLAPQRFLAALASVFAGIALLLAAIGIHGLVAGSVTERTREMGIRMALGSTVAQAMKAVALPGVALAAAGLVLGGLLAAAAARLLQAFLWGVGAADPATFVGVAGTLLLVATISSVMPALRLLRLDSARTLHED